MRRKYFYLNGKKYYNEEEYIKARNEFISYQNEQEIAFSKTGYKEMIILSGDNSEIVKFDRLNK